MPNPTVNRAYAEAVIGSSLAGGLASMLDAAHAAYLSVAHRQSGDMADKSYAGLIRGDDTGVAGRIGTASDHGLFEEEGHLVRFGPRHGLAQPTHGEEGPAAGGVYWWEGHHQIRDALLETLPHFGAYLTRAFEGGR